MVPRASFTTLCLLEAKGCIGACPAWVCMQADPSDLSISGGIDDHCFAARSARALSPLADPASIPLQFVRNVGQSDPAVRMEARGLGGTIFFGPNAVTLA